ncbi:hypothetical protein ACET3X_003160 [Alternaria dauci]|uniref:Uncharacterized protein n=1 Tax=Alternaria dauci TaxID=48095 RepID=A0ABR3USR4_9PLEO
MRRHHERLPNVRAIPFYLNFRKLTISAMLTLMAVDESSKTPLYLAEVEKILRMMQKSNGGDTVLDYAAFKKKIKEAGFTRDQMQPLQIRLNILDSFLDLNGTAEEPTYEPGEVTIMDLSDDTMSSSTACALFKLGMNDYLGSSAKGKMIVLDEAHKYMQDTPGAHLFTQGLKRVVTQMRHYGCRVVISTQEPTVANELIALCSITIMHRFTSPAWFSALKKHISVMEDNSNIMEQIEGLNTGEALVYAPGAVLGKNVDDSLVKATAQLLRIVVRDRLTQDGGESILAV